MASYNLLNQEEEDSLHKSRLLNVEEKPFKRITKRLLASDSLITTPLSFPPTPPPEGGDAENESTVAEQHQQKKIEEWRQFKEAVTLDFAAFESSIARIQFLLTNNEKERERYAAEKLRIQSTAQDVRDNTAELRVQLEAAQNTLNLRKTYDNLTEKITSNRLLRPREDQRSNLEKLQVEILELEKESKEYAKTWSERREQFGRIVEEGMQLRRLIRDEKEEVERREGMQEGDGDGGDEEDSTKGGRISGVNSPRPESEESAPPPTASSSLKLQTDRLQSETAGAASPLRQSISISEQKPEDVDMVDEGEVDELEEGEADEREEKMDTT
ncbi:conserved hypothetical protein [Talaromyces stipitatus ATCC 10500]|uniref:Tho complex subunit 7 n=1 Tax=Talaromyces stipitatus (strain ATCC 10500 / CBS 375.48 / QM 6759 / NRRL 1006) TaxID=441959 RepID=B8M1E8_TALSN|nr:uncharacterized protein TSTA_090840 [Talaromyces stipitatus ATCC 10500]EED21844.1 conserved hypothetical protein [Talaromyces stipitatus ATCC 10500]